MRISTIWHTIIRLKPMQIRYQLWYRIRGKLREISRFRYKTSIPCQGYPLKLSSWITKPTSVKGNAFEFLNLELDVGEQINWDEFGYGKLWTYNLNYMDYLLQIEMDRSTGTKYIMNFIQEFPQNQTGKEPYPISLRGINWIKFISEHKINESEISCSLFAQYHILMDNIEYHLLGNHLLENGLSMLFGSFYFRDHKIYSKARRILVKELSEQILSDGAHFELSPMYHQIILERLLDGINLLKHNQQFDDQSSLLKVLSEKASLMLGWISEISLSDGSIPLFNDSAFGIAPSTQKLVEYAARLEIPVQKVKLGESGYRSIHTKKFEARLDVGEVGPRYLAGHAHADTLNFELYLHGKPLIVDTGISTYEKSGRRQFERSTVAHNTVEVGTKNSSEVWGGFRMGRRARITHLKENEAIVKAVHDGYRPLGTQHERTFTMDQDTFEITDRLIGKGTREGIACFHFHPEHQPGEESGEMVFSNGKLTFEGAHSVTIKEFQYAPEFNKPVRSSLVEVRFSNRLSSLFSFN